MSAYSVIHLADLMNSAPLLITNARVRTLEGDGVAEIVAIENGRIAAVGSRDETRRWPKAEALDARGATVLPSIIDSHTHFHRAAVLRAQFIDLDQESFDSIPAVLDAVRERAAQTPKDRWIQGDSLREHRLKERRWPVRRELDSAAPDHPVILRSLGKHLTMANTVALRLAGIDRNTPDPKGGRIEHDADGEPTGVLHETAKLRLDPARTDTVVPPVSEDDRLRALKDGIRMLQQNGVTALHEIVAEPDHISDYLALRERGELGVRVRYYVRAVEARTRMEYVTGLGLRGGLGDAWLRLDGIKVSVDGSMESRNAALYDPYPGQPDNRGIVRVTQDELNEVFAQANRSHLQIAVHAIGPRAVDIALTAFEYARADLPRKDHRHRMEHAYVPAAPKQFERIKALDLLLSDQPALLYSSGDAYHEIFGADGVKNWMPLRKVLDMGIRVHANSDFPSTPMNPFIGLQAAVTRCSKGGREVDRSQAVTIKESVHMFTTANAYASFEERDAGTIAVGKRADLMLIDRDPFETPADQIMGTKVLATILDGDVVHRASAL
jgi:predicted amidohydrolase YtcJ